VLTPHLCGLVDCGRPHKGRGLCDLHLQRQRRTGTTASPVRTLAERFWSKVNRRGPGDCWPWTGATNEHGYGVLRPEGRRSGPGLKAHRVAAGLAGMDTEGRDVLHSCDNPPCCNAAHLRPGTPAENAADMVERNRVAYGERAGMAKLTVAEVVEIRRRRLAGERRKDLAAAFGVSGATVTRIASGQGWRRAVTPPAARDLIAALAEAITGEAA
jgi:hypothetical protein